MIRIGSLQGDGFAALDVDGETVVAFDPAGIRAAEIRATPAVRTITAQADVERTGRLFDLLAAGASPGPASFAVTMSGWVSVPVVPRSGPRPPSVSRARWAAARRMASWQRRRRRRAGLPATTTRLQTAAIPAVRIDRARTMFEHGRVAFTTAPPP